MEYIYIMSFGATNDSLVSDALSGLGKSSPSAIKYNKCGGKKRKSRKNRRSRKSRKSRHSRKSRKSRRKQKGGCGCGKMIGGKRRKSRRSRRRRTRKQRGGYSQYGNNVANTPSHSSPDTRGSMPWATGPVSFRRTNNC